MLSLGRRKEEAPVQVGFLWAQAYPLLEAQAPLRLVTSPFHAGKEEYIGRHCTWFLPHTCELRRGGRLQIPISNGAYRRRKMPEVRGTRSGRTQGPSWPILILGNSPICGCFDCTLDLNFFSCRLFSALFFFIFYFSDCML